MNLTKLHLLPQRNGTWSFCGSVPTELAYARRDGQPLRPEDIEAIQQCGPGIIQARSRVWRTKEEALEEAALHGFSAVTAPEQQHSQVPVDQLYPSFDGPEMMPIEDASEPTTEEDREDDLG